MRHKRRVKTFDRETGHRKALLRNLVYSLVEHGRIRTTVEKAKELRRHVERAVTTGKKGSLHAQRTLLAKYPNQKAVSVIMKDISPRFKDRPGGYTRILKVGRRPGDAAEMAIIEFVDYELPKAVNEQEGTEKKAATEAKPKADKSAKKAAEKKEATKKKAVKKAKKVAAKKKTKKKSASKKTASKKKAKKKTTKKKA
tara:strand:+ start:3264 stop:3857 length:594 start_codon:yes stop_codon:yes gene_type:complete